MQTKPTIKARQEWVRRACQEAGGVSAWAEVLGMDKSTISRQVNDAPKASPDFIGAVLNRYPIKFETAFEVVELSA